MPRRTNFREEAQHIARRLLTTTSTRLTTAPSHPFLSFAPRWARQDALLGLLETLFLFSEEYPTDCSEHLVRMSCYSEYRFCVEDENATLVKLEQVADDMRKYAADPEYDRDGDVIAKQFDTSPVVVPQLVCPKYCESNHTVGCVDMLRYALNKDLRGLPTLPSMLASVDRWFNCSSLREETERHPLALARCIGEPRLPSPPAPPPPPFVEAEENVTDVSVAPRLMRERITAAQGLAAAAIASRAIRLQL